MDAVERRIAELERKLVARAGASPSRLDSVPADLLERVLELARSYHLDSFGPTHLDRLRPYLSAADLADVEEFLRLLDGPKAPSAPPPVVRLNRADVAALGTELQFVNAALWPRLPGEALARKVRQIAEAADDGCEATTEHGRALLRKIRAAVRKEARFDFDDATPDLPAPQPEQLEHRETGT
jgi:hypothetical protein